MRPVSLVLLFLLLCFLPGWIPGYGPNPDTSLSFGKLLVDLVDPLVLLLAVLLPLLAGGWKGVRRGARFLVRGGPVEPSASRSLAAGGRALLWGTCLLSLINVGFFYWPAEPVGSGRFFSWDRLNYGKFGALLAVSLGSFLFLPAAEAAAPGKRGSRAARALDLLAPFGLLASSLVILLSLFVYRAAVLGEPDSGLSYVLPRAAGIDLALTLWSVLGVLVVALLAAFATPRGVAPLAGRFARLSLAAGVLLATLIELAGLAHIAATSGNANPAEVQFLAGRMLVPVVVGILLAAAAGLHSWKRSSGTTLETRPRGVGRGGAARSTNRSDGSHAV